MAEDGDAAPWHDAVWRESWAAHEARELYPDSLIAELTATLPGFVDDAARDQFPELIRRWATTWILITETKAPPRPRKRREPTRPGETRDALEELAMRLEAVGAEVEAIKKQLCALAADAEHALVKACLPPADDDVPATREAMRAAMEEYVEAGNTLSQLQCELLGAIPRFGFLVARFATIARRAVDSMFVPRGRLPNRELREALRELVEIYMRVTGKEPDRSRKFRAFAEEALRPLWPAEVTMSIAGHIREVGKEYRPPR